MENNESTRPKQTSVSRSKSMVLITIVMIGLGVVLLIISLYDMNESTWISLDTIIDSLFSQDLANQIVSLVPRVLLELAVDNIFWTLVGIYLIVQGSWTAVRKLPLSLALDREGVSTTGIVIDTWIESSFYVGAIHWVAYEYLNGLRAKENVNKKTYNSLKIGDKVTVRYLPGNPAPSRLEFRQSE